MHGRDADWRRRLVAFTVGCSSVHVAVCLADTPPARTAAVAQSSTLPLLNLTLQRNTSQPYAVAATAGPGFHLARERLFKEEVDPDPVVPPARALSASPAPKNAENPALILDARQAIFTGVVFGVVHVLGPDHIGTLVALSTLMEPSRAFWVGAAWGFGHSLGMLLIAAVLLPMNRIFHVKSESWAHIGDYFVGASLVICSLYFMLRESSFLEHKDDGTYEAVACACHGTQGHAKVKGGRGGRHYCRSYQPGGLPPSEKRDPVLPCPSPAPAASAAERRARRRIELAAGSWNNGDSAGFVPPPPWHEGEQSSQGTEMDSVADAEREPLIEAPPSAPPLAAEEDPTMWWQRAWAARDVQGACLGLFQGACCPMGLVGVSFLTQFPAWGVAVFLLTFLLVSCIGTAMFALSWAYLTNLGIGVSVRPEKIYRGSCCFTFVLGVVWIVANYFGVLDKLDFELHESPSV